MTDAAAHQLDVAINERYQVVSPGDAYIATRRSPSAASRIGERATRAYAVS